MTPDELAEQLTDEWDKLCPGGNSGPEFYDGVAVGIQFAVDRLHPGEQGGT